MVDTTGNHTIKLSPMTNVEILLKTRQVVSLASVCPGDPGHTVTEQLPMNVTGTSLFTTVILRVNGVVVTQTPHPLHTFSFGSIELKEGDNFLL